jgi:hypothetical protein
MFIFHYYEPAFAFKKEVVIPAPDKGIRGQAPSGIQVFRRRNNWMPAFTSMTHRDGQASRLFAV